MKSFPPYLRIFSVFFHPSFSQKVIGGAEKRFIHIVEASEKLGVKFIVLESFPSVFKRLAFAHCKAYESRESLDFNTKSWTVLFLKWSFWSLKACFYSVVVARKEKCEIILTPNNTLPNLLPSFFAGFVLHLPTYIVVHHLDVLSLKVKNTLPHLFYNYRRLGYSKIAAFIKSLAFLTSLEMLKRCKACIAVSKFTADTLEVNGVSKAKIFTSSNGIEYRTIEKVKPLYRKKFFDAVFVGRISWEKGISDLVFAWKKVTVKDPYAKLLIIGVGPQLAELKEIIQKLGLNDNVFVKGYCEDEEMYALMKSSKTYIFPSMFEGWGLSIAEALACGLPVICYDIPALKEVFGGCRSVFLVPVGDLFEFASQISRVLNMDYKVLGKEGKSFVRKFTWEQAALRDIEAILQSFS